jgi:hypothetical protein
MAGFMVDMPAAPAAEPAPLRSGSVARVAILAGVTIFFAWAVYGHRLGLNDEKYLYRNWRHLPAFPLYWQAAAGAIPFFLGQWLFGRRPEAVYTALTLVTLSSIGIMVVCTFEQDHRLGSNRIEDMVTSRTANGFFEEAARLDVSGLGIRRWLATYPQRVPQQVGHANSKPPGPILFNYLVVRFFGDGRLAANVAGLFMAILAAVSVPATYAFIGCFTRSVRAAFLGASFMALSPSLMLFYPQFDQFYPVLTAGLAILWAAALRTNRSRYAAAHGVLFGVTTFINYLPCVLGLFLIGYALLYWLEHPAMGVRRILAQAAVAIGAFVGFYLVLWLASGFDPIATLRACWPQVSLFNQWLAIAGYPPRRLPGTIPWDLWGFAMGSGWIGFVLAGCYFVRLKFSNSWATWQARIATLCVAQFVLEATTGLIQGETERLWIFMMPMLMLPIGLELASWSLGERMTAYGALLVLTILICQNITFLA